MDGIGPDSPIEDLLAKIEFLSGIPAATQSWRAGFPPKTIVLSGCAQEGPGKTLADIGIQNREVIHVGGEPVAGATNAPPASANVGAAATAAGGVSGRAAAPSSSAAASSAAPPLRPAGGPAAQPPQAQAPPSTSQHPALPPNVPAAPRYAPPSADLMQKTSASGQLTERNIVPADNSCLFTSLLLNLNLRSSLAPADLRRVVARFIENDPSKYNPLTLAESGKTSLEYAEWICKPDSWGGFLELQTMADWFGIQIVAVDVTSSGRLEFFPAEEVGVDVTSSGRLEFFAAEEVGGWD